MGKAEIIAELPNLSQADLADIQAKLDELISRHSDEWIDHDELTDADRQAIDEGLTAYLRAPDDVTDIEEALARIQANLKR